MKNRNSTLFYACGIIGMIFGILECLTIVGLIFGIPLIIGSNKYIKYHDLTDEEITNEKNSIVLWGVVIMILAFPFGLLTIIPLFNLNGRIDETTKKIEDSFSPTEKANKEMDIKIQKIKRLQELKDNGTITEEEFKKVKEKILME